MSIVLHPAPNCPLITVVGHPVLDKIDALGIYEYSTFPDDPPFIEPNVWSNLRPLFELDIPIDIEAAAESQLHPCGAESKSYDEFFHKHSKGIPGRKHPFPGETEIPYTHELTDYEGLAQTIAPLIKRDHDDGYKVNLKESYPDPNGWRPHLKAMLDRAWELEPWDHMTWDINWTAIDDQKPNPRWWHTRSRRKRDREAYRNQINADLIDMFHWAGDRDIETGVIVGSPTGRGVTTAAEFVAYAEIQITRVRQVFEPDVWVIQDWEGDQYPKALTTVDDLAKIVEMLT